MGVLKDYSVEFSKSGIDPLINIATLGVAGVVNDGLNSAMNLDEGWDCTITDKDTGKIAVAWGKTKDEAESFAKKALIQQLTDDKIKISFETGEPDAESQLLTLGMARILEDITNEIFGLDSGWRCVLRNEETGEKISVWAPTKKEAQEKAHAEMKKKIQEQREYEREQEKKRQEEYKQELIREQEEKYRLQQIQKSNKQSYGHLSEGSTEGCAVQIGLIVALITVVAIAIAYILIFAVAFISLAAPIVMLIGYFVRSKKHIPFANKFTDSSTDENPMHESPWAAGIAALLSGILVWGVWGNAEIQGITRELGGDSLLNYIGYIYLFVGSIATFFLLKSLLQGILPYKENGTFFWREDSRLLMIGGVVLCLLGGLGYGFYSREISYSPNNYSANQNNATNNNDFNASNQSPNNVINNDQRQTNLNTNEKIRAVINDKDGFTNVRAEASNHSEIIGKVYENESFIVISMEGDWWKVELPNGANGFMHKSRISIIK
jgi:hypothetical protein